MELGEGVRFAWMALSEDKFKAVLTMLGITIGSAAIVLVVTIGLVGKSYIVNLIEGIGANLAYATLDRTGNTQLQDELTIEDLNAARYLPGVTAAAGTYDQPIDFVANARVVHVRLVGVTEQFQEIRNLQVLSGRYFDAEDFSTHDNVCVVSASVADRIAGSVQAALGTTLKLEEFRCMVVGTFKERVSTFGSSEIQNDTVLVTFPVMKIINGVDFLQVLYVQAESRAMVPFVTEGLQKLLRRRHRSEARYDVENLTSLLETAQTVSMAMTWVLVGVALLTLTTAGVGIMNIMLFNVLQRTREIGIRIAIGARQSDIRVQFLLEAVFISVAGSICGIVLALVLIASVSSFGLAPVEVSWVAVLLTVLVGAGTGILFGYQPAAQAARLNPIEALRAE